MTLHLFFLLRFYKISTVSLVLKKLIVLFVIVLPCGLASQSLSPQEIEQDISVKSKVYQVLFSEDINNTILNTSQRKVAFLRKEYYSVELFLSKSAQSNLEAKDNQNEIFISKEIESFMDHAEQNKDGSVFSRCNDFIKHGLFVFKTKKDKNYRWAIGAFSTKQEANTLYNKLLLIFSKENFSIMRKQEISHVLFDFAFIY